MNGPLYEHSQAGPHRHHPSHTVSYLLFPSTIDEQSYALHDVHYSILATSHGLQFLVTRPSDPFHYVADILAC
jgi:hypothetical protein